MSSVGVLAAVRLRVGALRSLSATMPTTSRIAAAAAATATTGVLVHEKHYDHMAEVMHQVIRDASLRASILHGQQLRLRRYLDRDADQELRQHLAPVL